METTLDLNSALTQIASKTLQAASGFAGLPLFPLFYTSKPSAGYYVLGDDTFLEAPNVRRAPGTPYSRTMTKLADDTYSAEIYGHEEPVSYEENAKYARFNAALEAGTRRAENVILLAHEIRAQQMATAASVPGAALSIPWTDSTSDPVTDVNAARKAVFYGCGLEANLITLPRAVFEALKLHPKIKEKIKISGTDSRWPQMLSALFDVDRVVVARALVNNANEGQTISAAEIWGASVIVAHVDDQPEAQDLQAPSFGRTFIVAGDATPLGVQVEHYDVPKIKSLIIRASQWTDEKITAPKAGYHLKNVLG
jgi:hypothetical protein